VRGGSPASVLAPWLSMDPASCTDLTSGKNPPPAESQPFPESRRGRCGGSPTPTGPAAPPEQPGARGGRPGSPRTRAQRGCGGCLIGAAGSAPARYRVPALGAAWPPRLGACSLGGPPGSAPLALPRFDVSASPPRKDVSVCLSHGCVVGLDPPEVLGWGSRGCRGAVPAHLAEVPGGGGDVVAGALVDEPLLGQHVLVTLVLVLEENRVLCGESWSWGQGRGSAPHPGPAQSPHPQGRAGQRPGTVLVGNEATGAGTAPV